MASISTQAALNKKPPRRCIFSQEDLGVFKKSVGCKEIHDFIKLCADAVAGKRVSDFADDTTCPAMVLFVRWQESLRHLVVSIPPIQQPMRFGNKAFRVWHSALLTKEIPSFLGQIQPELDAQSTSELAAYLAGAFGNETRIDYGTGHEVFIIIFFMGLIKVGVLRVQDFACIVLQGFAAYMKTMRTLQDAYLLEPAGSHGVWGLDDYHCLPFLFGAAQLVNHATIKPSSVHELSLLEAQHHDYLYLSCILTIRRTKIGAPFSETSPMLNDISNMHDWLKVCNGLLRLFQGEVLFKLPVVQHLLFGSFLSMDPLTLAVSPNLPTSVEQNSETSSSSSSCSILSEQTSSVANEK